MGGLSVGSASIACGAAENSATRWIARRLALVASATMLRPATAGAIRAPILDGVVLARKTGPAGQAGQPLGLKAHGAIRRPVSVALSLREDGKKEVVDFRLAHSESAASAKCGDEPGQWRSSPTAPQMDRLLFAVFNHANRNQGLSHPHAADTNLLS